MFLLSVLDNGGRTFDRYTISFVSDEGESCCFGASDNPFHPQGFGQYVGDMCFPDTDENLEIGEPVTFDSLPLPVQKFINQTEGMI